MKDDRYLRLSLSWLAFIYYKELTHAESLEFVWCAHGAIVRTDCKVIVYVGINHEKTGLRLHNGYYIICAGTLGKRRSFSEYLRTESWLDIHTQVEDFFNTLLESSNDMREQRTLGMIWTRHLNKRLQYCYDSIAWNIDLFVHELE